MTCRVLGHAGGGDEDEALADGRFYEVTCEGMTKTRSVVGWTEAPDGGSLVRLVNGHPTWHSPEIRDIRSKPQ